MDRFLRWACKGGAPAATVVFDAHERPKAAPPRTHVLDAGEIAEIWNAAKSLPNAVIADLVQFLISTPCRESEAASMTWRDIDLDARVWHQPAGSVKNNQAHDYPLNAPALEILERRLQQARGALLVFPGPVRGDVFCGWSNLKAALDKRTRVVGWRFHDLRRSIATHLGERGFSESLIDLLINHRASRTRGGVLGVYQRSERWTERVAALDAWARLLAGWVGDGPVSEPEVVTPFRRIA